MKTMSTEEIIKRDEFVKAMTTVIKCMDSFLAKEDFTKGYGTDEYNAHANYIKNRIIDHDHLINAMWDNFVDTVKKYGDQGWYIAP